MSAPMRISLRAGERIYINGAVLRAERKLTFELLNNASFLLENHIIQAEEATTPLRQLYFALQAALDWSCRLLSPAELVALQDLSAFTASFRLAGALDVMAAADAPAGIDMLSSLVAKSLV